MNIAIDWGNTNIKIGVFENGDIEKIAFNVKAEEVINLINQYKAINLILGKTGNIPASIYDHLATNYRIYTIDANTRLPIKNNYETPEKLGEDRLAGITGANKLFPGQNTLVIDMGTCITYDFIDKANVYQGGAISPGYRMRLKAMHTFTSQLPDLSPDPELHTPNELPWVGKNTADCMYSGVINGIQGELTQIIRMYHNKFAPLNLIISGGDGEFFARQIKDSKFVIPELVLIGLNRILQYNVKAR